MPPRPRSHSYTGPNTAKATTVTIPPFHPINSVISDEHRAAHNLRVLQRHDPKIRVIHDQIPYVCIRLMKPPGASTEPSTDPDNDEFWEDEVDGPEGPLFFVEREAESLDDRLGFCVLGNKDIFSWFQILHRDDEIEFSPEMSIIVPSGRQDVMWPVLRSSVCEGVYSAYVTRLLARCHLLLKYGLEWPDRWRSGHGKLPEQSVPNPQSASHETSSVPLRETDVLQMVITGSQITEIERVAEEIVAVVSLGGTWCRNEYSAPPDGWPEGWVEPKGTTKDVWGPVVSNPKPGETSTARATLTNPSSAVSNGVLEASTIKTTPKKDKDTSTPSKKKTQNQNQQQQRPPPSGRVLNNDVLSNLLAAPFKPPSEPAPQDEHKTPVPADFISLPQEPVPPIPPLPNGKGRRAKGKGKKAGAGNKASSSAAELGTPFFGNGNAQESKRESSVSPVRWRTLTFDVIDDRLSDEEEDETTEVSVQSSPNSSRGVPEKAIPEKVIDHEDLERLSQSLGLPPPFIKYHKKGYIPQNTEERPVVDTDIMHDVLLNAVSKEKDTNFPLLERNEWIRELLQLIHTNKKFVDGIYNDYKARLGAAASSS